MKRCLTTDLSEQNSPSSKDPFLKNKPIKKSMIFRSIGFHKSRAYKLITIAHLHSYPFAKGSRFHHKVNQRNHFDTWFAKVVCTLFYFHSHLLDLHTDYISKGLTPLIAFDVVRKLDGIGTNPNLAFGFFKFSRVNLSLVHDLGTYNYLLRSLCELGLHDSVSLVLDWMMIDGHLLDSSVLGFLVGSFAEAGRVDIARKVLVQAECIGTKASSFLNNKFLNVLVRQCRVDEAVRFFNEQMVSKSNLDTCSSNILIRGLCRAGHVDKAVRVFKDMDNFGLFPDVITYNTLIDGLCRVNEVRKAHELLMEAKSRHDVSPDVVTYTSVISGFCKVGKMEEANLLFQEMMSAGIRPTIVTFNVLIDGFGKVGDMASALALYEKMLFLGCVPDVITFTSRIDGYSRIGQLDMALKLWEEMIGRNLSPNEYTFSVLIVALCKENRLDEACNLLDQLKFRNVTPQPFMYNPVIDGVCKAGNVDKANLIASEMEQWCKPDKYTFTILIIGHCMKGRMLEAINIFNKMLAVKCTPDDITVKSLISCLVKAGMPNEASQIKKRLVLEKVELRLSSSGRSFPAKANMDIQVAA